MRRRAFEILGMATADDTPSRLFGVFIMALITLNVLVVILETEESLSAAFGTFFDTFEILSVAVFTGEYVLRLWTCTLDEKYEHPILGRLRFALSPLALVDLMAILPFYLPLLFVDLRFLRALRLFRLFRLFKMARYTETLRIFGNVLKAKKEDLIIILFAVSIVLVFASSLMYLVEHDAQPKVFSSIPSAIWWGIVTLTTIGYGDIYPVTPLGRLFGGIIAISSIGLFALPAGVLASGFSEGLQSARVHRRNCPYCGSDIDDPSVTSPDGQ